MNANTAVPTHTIIRPGQVWSDFGPQDVLVLGPPQPLPNGQFAVTVVCLSQHKAGPLALCELVLFEPLAGGMEGVILQFHAIATVLCEDLVLHMWDVDDSAFPLIKETWKYASGLRGRPQTEEFPGVPDLSWDIGEEVPSFEELRAIGNPIGWNQSWALSLMSDMIARFHAALHAGEE